MPLRRLPFAAALALALALAGCGSDASQPTAGTGAATPSGSASACAPQNGPDNFSDTVPLKTQPDGLQVGDFRIGCGPTAAAGQTITVQYTGWLANGTKFDSSRDHGGAFTTQLTTDNLIPGWVEGIPGMKVGGKRRLVIPPELGYGVAGDSSMIPPNSTLIFDIELLGVQ